MVCDVEVLKVFVAEVLEVGIVFDVVVEVELVGTVTIDEVVLDVDGVLEVV